MQKNIKYILVGTLVLSLIFLAFKKPADQTFEEFMRGQPVIDVHVHVTKGFEGDKEYNGRNLQEGAQLDNQRLFWMLNDFNAHNVVLALAGGTKKYAVQYSASDRRIWGGISFPCSKIVDSDEPCEKEFLTYEELKNLYEIQELKSMGESVYNYYGIPPTDPRLEPYWRLASEMNIPVGIHSDSGPAKVNEEEHPNYNPEFANPELLEPILQKYPGLKINLMHFGNEYTEQAIALMKKYPQVYCDISAVSIMLPKEIWEPNLRRLYAEGLGDRLMFGSDYFGTLRESLKAIYDIGWLDWDDKRDILYFNAARFLELTPEEIKQHHEWVRPAQP